MILCGGQGTRAYPHTRHIPKAMMSVAGLPTVEQVMRIYASQGFDEFILAVGYRKEALIEYFDQHRSWNVECLDTGNDADTGTRLYRCLDHVGDTFHATYCDGLGDVDLNALVSFHHGHGDGATVTTVPLRSQYGLLLTDDQDRITHFVEKPTLPEHWINAGFFVLDRDVLQVGHCSNLERDVLPQLASRRQLRAYRHRGFWRSMDTYKDQQELDVLWAPFSRDLDFKLPWHRDGVPHWLSQPYASAEAEPA